MFRTLVMLMMLMRMMMVMGMVMATAVVMVMVPLVPVVGARNREAWVLPRVGQLAPLWRLFYPRLCADANVFGVFLEFR